MREPAKLGASGILVTLRKPESEDVYTYIHTHICICVYVMYMYIHIYICFAECIHMYIYIYIYICVYMYIYIDLFTCSYLLVSCSIQGPYTSPIMMSFIPPCRQQLRHAGAGDCQLSFSVPAGDELPKSSRHGLGILHIGVLP